MATKMSVKMLAAVPGIHKLMLAGKKCQTACAELGIKGQSAKTVIKNYMKYHGYIDEHGKAIKKESSHDAGKLQQSQSSVEQFSKVANAKAKQPDIHDEFDEEIFRQRVSSFNKPNNAYVGSKQTFVFTCALNDAEVDKRFFETLEFYCKTKDAELFVAPLRYTNPTSTLSFAASRNMTWDPVIKPYICRNEVDFGSFRFCGNLNINATNSNPINGFNEMSRGKTLIIPHPRLSMQSLARLKGVDPAIVRSTGSITKPCYSDSKAGYRAEFNHEMSAIVVELDGDIFHITEIIYDGNGFYDRGDYWEPNQISHFVDSCQGLVMGDTHFRFADKRVLKALFEGPDSICARLKPVAGVFHDLLDFNSGTHHDIGEHYNMFAKHHAGQNDIQDELDEALNFVINTPFREKLIVGSNHNDHLFGWAKRDIGDDYQNRKFWHLINYLILDSTEYGPAGATCGNPFELYAKASINEQSLDGVEFLTRTDSREIAGIEVSCHGDIGINGARGNARQYSSLPEDMVVGHSHSPCIIGNCWQVGTTSILRMGYNKGPSSWMHTMVAIYNNGKRQMINVIDGKWMRT